MTQKDLEREIGGGPEGAASEQEENPLRAERRRKLQGLRAAGIDPFPHNYRKTDLSDVIARFGHLQTGETAEDSSVQVAGRLITRRPMGKAAFFNIQDGSAAMQGYLKIEELDEKSRLAYEGLDIGDIVGLQGKVFRTKKGELSIHTSSFQILCKTLEPLPEKYHGVQDVEIKYRHRHLDLIADEESRQVFVRRSRIITEIRKWLTDRGFLEVETPVLQPVYGGASAFPFQTHHRALDMRLYLKISPELYLKRLIVGGFEKVFEIGKNFRNEGIDRSHNPEFTMLEWYEAYTDYLDQMAQFESLVAHLAETITGSKKVVYQGREIDFTPPWRRLSVEEGVKLYGGIDPAVASLPELVARARSLGADATIESASRGEVIMEIFELSAEAHLWQPTFVMDHPVEISPLTKAHRMKPGLVERFEPFAACMEIGNAYTELNDPEEQFRRLKDQESRRVLDEEAHPMDEDFMHAIDVGMPPTGGVGLGIERIVMLLTDRPSIRDIILFPTMRFK